MVRLRGSLGKEEAHQRKELGVPDEGEDALWGPCGGDPGADSSRIKENTGSQLLVD